MKPKLSILIPTVQEREELLSGLLKSISMQCKNLDKVDEKQYSNYTIKTHCNDSIEIIICFDNKKLSVGKKRNILKAVSNGRYITYIDDDDKISNDYIEEIIKAIDNNDVDLITYKARMYVNGKHHVNVMYDVRFMKDFDSHRGDGVGTAYRVPNHLMVWKKDVVKYVDFPNISLGEDSIWAKRCRGKVMSVRHIDKYLYNYMFDTNTTLTQRR